MTELIYLASPYSHPDPVVRQMRSEAVCKVAGKLFRDGLMVFCPIAHSHPICVYGECSGGFDFWEAYDRLMLSKCSALYVCCLQGWDASIGVQAEIEFAKELGLPITFVDENGDRLS